MNPDMSHAIEGASCFQYGKIAASLVREIPPGRHDLYCHTVLEIFVKQPELYSLAIVNDRYHPIGIVDRHTFVDKFVTPYAKDLYGRKRIIEFMDNAPIIVETDTTIDDLARIIIDAGRRRMMSGYIFTSNGVYAGMGNSHDLLDLITRKRQEHLYYLAHFDPLTQLPNRLLFQDRLQQACAISQRRNSLVALLFIDLDRFKFINDTYGHHSGDVLLKTVAVRLRMTVRTSDTVARLSGDEFTVILENLCQPEQAIGVAEKIIYHLSLPVSLNDHMVYISASIGIALCPFHDDNPEGLVRKADAATYKAKSDYRGHCLLYAERMDAGLLERLTLEGSLRSALDHGEFDLYYQPQCCALTGEVLGVEALVRWRHPQLGLVPPGKFIPMAEETGLIVKLGNWIMREACKQCLRWDKLGLPPVRVAVNISAIQFRQLDFPLTVGKIIEETGISPRLLEFELTEGIVMTDIERVVSVLGKLKEIGLTLAIDDFGTGYSSLAYLRDLPVEIIKIDRCFIHEIDRNPTNLAIVRTIIALGENLGLKVIAEGVETPEELDLLTSNGCLGIQGYYIAKPMPADEFQEWMRAYSQCGKIHPASSFHAHKDLDSAGLVSVVRGEN